MSTETTKPLWIAHGTKLIRGERQPTTIRVRAANEPHAIKTAEQRGMVVDFISWKCDCGC